MKKKEKLKLKPQTFNEYKSLLFEPIVPQNFEPTSVIKTRVIKNNAGTNSHAVDTPDWRINTLSHHSDAFHDSMITTDKDRGKLGFVYV
jgi:hypothetical protein